ncbi:NAD(P)/FAD-dependent oxidoreductase [Sinimarinibacterium sp. CAU 1509]|uniref:flavin-containing monooxygenase n=1 Tax=Sinimarinibacterium sp. CAU 1509 TaxID=2562283 RepID=UPI0010ABB99A|nr:NAD(P)/FAD-dependent oxidoreductase [Sinimarinibacterium sp. CAU 1509]TJY63281.1 NAD(P)/FAD-dependent oxidoreductase [Sinimarinibacterium sp. CAU 1509]
MQSDYDVLIVGAGLSGIGMACHLAIDCPGKRVAILERRKAIGGTWDLFRYPGIRSDSDMFTFGYKFRPWHALKVLADGESIRNYVRDTAREYGVEQKIQFGLKITGADWSSELQHWTVTALEEETGKTRTFTSNYLVSCTGYYNYDKGYLPEFPGVERFKGRCIHPQHWPENLDYRGKRVVVIGSGATAVTLVPAMAADAAHVTMLQRSPSYVFSVPGSDKSLKALIRFLPEHWVYSFARRRNMFLQRTLFKAAKRWPDKVRSWLLNNVRKQVGESVDMRHFTPAYKPWDERLCAVPDADLFKVIKAGKASVVTDHIETFTEKGILLTSGQELEADIIVTATGLQIQVFGGVDLRVDGQLQKTGELMTYKGTLMQDVPNMAWIIGYTNASWTLKADIASEYFCRLLNFMDQHGYAVATARAPSGEVQQAESIMGSLSSGYVRRGDSVLPRQGRNLPWRVLNNYVRDRPMLLEQPIDDGLLEFKRPAAVSQPTAKAA